MNWQTLTHVEQVKSIAQDSCHTPVILFKHSTRCSINSVAKDRFERQFDIENAEAYLLDLLSFREVSNFIAQFFDVAHQSPQALLIVDGNCLYHSSHLDIYVNDIKDYLANVVNLLEK